MPLSFPNSGMSSGYSVEFSANSTSQAYAVTAVYQVVPHNSDSVFSAFRGLVNQKVCSARAFLNTHPGSGQPRLTAGLRQLLDVTKSEQPIRVCMSSLHGMLGCRSLSAELLNTQGGS